MRKVLLVDADRRAARQIVRALRAEGLDVVCVADAHTASQIVFRERPALILLDPDLPRYSGSEFHEHLLAMPRGKDIPVIYLTHPCDWVGREAALRQAAAAHLTKPCDAQTLMETIREVFGADCFIRPIAT